LDLPLHAFCAVGAFGIVGAEHHEAGPPPTVERILRHFFLLRRSFREHAHDLVALALMEAFLLADAYHGPGIRAVAGACEHHLVHDRGTVDEPADRADIRPRKCWVIEDAAVLGLAAEQILDRA